MEIALFSIVSAVVTSHQAYGLTMRLSSGDRGFVDSDYIDSRYVPPAHWPKIGQSVVGVVLGVAADQRVRVCLRANYVELAQSVADLEGVLSTWRRITFDEIDDYDRTQFIRTQDGLSVLRWALREHVDSATFHDALRLLSTAPTPVIAEVAPQLHQRADLVKVRRILDTL